MTHVVTIAWLFGLLLGYALGLFHRRERTRCAYVRGWCAGVRVTIQDLLDFVEVPVEGVNQ